MWQLPRVEIKQKPVNYARKLAEVSRNLRATRQVRVGLPKGVQDYPDGTSLVEVATRHEFGDGSIPQRSFLRSTVSENETGYRDVMAGLAKRVVNQKDTPEQAMGKLGQTVVSDVQKKIAEGIQPELSPETIQRKKSSKPLIDTGHLRQSITWEINDSFLPTRKHTIPALLVNFSILAQ